MVSERSYDVFLSYNSLDRELVDSIADALKARDCDSFVDQWYLKPGRDWVAALERALQQSKAVAIFVGPHEMGRWQQRERAWALDRQTQQADFAVIPVLLPGCEPPLGFLQQFMWIDLRDDPTDAGQLDALAAAIRNQPIDSAARAQSSVCPYRGLEVFREEDASFFFGRDEYIDQLNELTQHQSFVAVIGPSGSGKSSVIGAGLIPRLRKRGEGSVCDVVRMVPGRDPLLSLAEVIVPLADPNLSGLSLTREIRAVAEDLAKEKPELPLSDLIDSVLRAQPGTDRLFLFVDQWEELYTTCDDPQRRERFISLMLDSTAGKNSTLSVVMTVRGDFNNEISQHRRLLDRIKSGRVDLGPMNANELRSAIEGPAVNVELTFQDGLVDRIIKDVGEEPGRLALLEFALKELWNRRDGAQLTHAGYEDLGGVSRSIATYAESIYEGLPAEEQEALPRLFRRIVQAGKTADLDTRRRATLSDLDEQAQQAARQLADKRLLITARSKDTQVDDQSASTTVEVAHEQLLQNWQRLRKWIDADRAFLLWRGRLDLKVDEYRRDGKPALLRDKQLSEAKEFYPSRTAELESAQIDFLDESLKTIRRRHQISIGAVIGTVVFLIVSAYFLWPHYRQYQRDRAVATIQSFGGKVSQIEHGNGDVKLYIEIGDDVTGEFDNLLDALHKLEPAELDCWTCGLTDENIRGISNLTSLQRLSLVGNMELSGANIGLLANLPQLVSLDMRVTGVTSCQPFATLKQLLNLDLGGTGIRELSGFSDVNSLAELSAKKAYELDHVDLVDLPSLEVLDVSESGSPNAGEVRIQNLPKLTSFYFNKTKFKSLTSRDLDSLVELQAIGNDNLQRACVLNAPKMRILKVMSNDDLTRLTVTGARNLERVYVTGNPGLRRFDLVDCGIIDAVTIDIAENAEALTINLVGTSLSEAHKEKLEDAGVNFSSEPIDESACKIGVGD